MARDRLLLDGLLQMRWAMHRPTLERMVAIVERHAAGVRLDTGELERISRERDARVAVRRGAFWDDDEPTTPDAKPYNRLGRTGVVSMHGVISRYSDRINGTSQPSGITTDSLAAAVREGGRDSLARVVMIDSESPGGSFEGISDVTEAIREVRAVKPVIGMAHETSCSAAYWILSQCERVYATPTATLGSIGVLCVVEDSSKAYEQQGIYRKLIASGPFKGAGSEGTPVTPAHLQSFQDEINACAQVFVQAVAQGRGRSVEEVGAWADGSCRVGKDAVDMGLADELVGARELLDALNAAE